MTDQKLEEQIHKVDRVIHKMFHVAFAHNPELKMGDMSVLTSGAMHIIELVYKNPDLILKEIREYLNLPQTTLSSRIAKLEKLDLIKRVITARDMRSFSLEITEKGRELFEEHKRLDYTLAKEGLLALEEDERDLFIAMLEKVIKHLEK